MPTSSPEEVAQLFKAWKQGDILAFEQLHALVYTELHQRAGRYLRRERRDHTLQPTALINEVYLRLLENTPAQIETRNQFLAIAANLMRRILVEYARRGGAEGEQRRRYGKAPLEDALERVSDARVDLVTLIALDEALQGLEKFDPLLGQLVELRYFAGITEEETAAILGLSLDAVKRRWKKARTWLQHELQESPT